MGYCCFDTVKQEMLSPSALFLSMREKYGSEVKNLPLIEYPRVIEENTIVPYDAVWGTDDYAPTADEKEGKEDAGKERPGGGEENGGPDTPGEVIERSMFFSPSGLDTFLSCPAKYNYQRIRRIPEEDYAVPDSSIWLNAADKGSYFHLILQEYID